jgi:chromosome segregation ATPase
MEAGNHGVNRNPDLRNRTRTSRSHRDRLLENSLRQMLEIKRLESEVTRKTMENNALQVKALQESLAHTLAWKEEYRREYQAAVREATQRTLLNMQNERDAWKSDMTEAVQNMLDLREDRNVYTAVLNDSGKLNLSLQDERNGLKVELAGAAQSMFEIQNERDGLRTELAALKEIQRPRSEKPDASKNQRRDKLVQIREVLQSCEHFNLEESISKQQSDLVLHVSPAAHELCTENQLKAIGVVVQILTAQALGSNSKPSQGSVT